MSVVLHNLYCNTIDSITTDKQVSIFRKKEKSFLPDYIVYVYPVKNTKCNVLYIFICCSTLTIRSSEKYTTDIQFIYCANRTYFFGCILVYGSLLFSSSAHVMKQEISNGRNYFYFKYDKTDNSYPALIGKVTPQT
jgi:hypothetical protein